MNERVGDRLDLLDQLTADQQSFLLGWLVCAATSETLDEALKAVQQYARTTATVRS